MKEGSGSALIIRFPEDLAGGRKYFEILNHHDDRYGINIGELKQKLRDLVGITNHQELDFSLSMDGECILLNHEHEWLKLRENDTHVADLKIRLKGGGNNASHQTTVVRNIEKKVLIDQKVDRHISDEVRKRIVFDPDNDTPSTASFLVHFHEYVGSTWQPVMYENLKQSNNNVQELKIVTYNVWFDLLEREARMLEIVQICQNANADIICLQEVTRGSLEILTKQSWIRNNFYISDSLENGGTTVSPYGVMIFVKKNLPVVKLFLNELPTRMFRSALSLELKVNDQILCFSTIHLESLDSQSLRAQQMYLISTFLKLYDTGFLCGDFNFDSEENYHKDTTPLENENLENFYPDFMDIWKELKYPLQDMGKTFLGDQSRLDRMLLKSSIFEPVEITMLGTKPFKEAHGKPIYPSDHFGLLTTLRRKK
ncbi:hypothetical protein C9374_001767 [Naegleria lovaniensis]|uniref:Endonuclease/exonuclease/phosphatase domain-containing protein n=1 Tax=Naegleria lovaniensis TaxID=51637 RepID=A0AA88GV18_NAELO|nr:uncharacterized protein C9374_001767 [Naegleria lovaniensis]KAG2387435.1 hypothetical protein C9374_001767 [Naegleria lovaniensis]